MGSFILGAAVVLAFIKREAIVKFIKDEYRKLKGI
jgi:hypothetical protein